MNNNRLEEKRNGGKKKELLYYIKKSGDPGSRVNFINIDKIYGVKIEYKATKTENNVTEKST